MKILAFFTSSGTPVTGLTPTIRIRDLSDNSLVITDASMSEVGDGHYQYNFTAYDKDTDYAIRCDGGITLNESDRYTYAGNENYIDDINETISQNVSGSNTEITNISTKIDSLSASNEVNFNTLNTNISEVNTNVLSASASIRSDLSTITGLINAIPGNVWDELLADHTILGSYGYELATKGDIAASTSTTETVSTSGGILNGTNNLNGYQVTFVRDNVYWQIQEDAVNGITVEFDFNIPNGERAGVVKTFGRYVGIPNTTHYIELWAYNFESLAWELLQEIFMPGGITSDSENTHAYFERHIDRDNNNQVKIRLIHHTTIYNPTHILYLDYVAITSIDVITAADIASAVWSEPTSGYSDSTRFGGLIVQLSNDLKRLLGLTHENIFIDNPVYDSDGNLTSARVRIYSNPASVGTASDVIGVYEITAPSNAPGQFTSWKQVRIS